MKRDDYNAARAIVNGGGIAAILWFVLVMIAMLIARAL